ncbi:AAA family ATPase [Alkanindiges illinoisensis]|uniref:AAA family ATPase n=1 Tax=Alkanindiges illinoisensis TaxID=197183 RepID=A0A4Y7XG68_9GAMM|nr:AAA family ATPase [Alkanindiges illinoisensis]TEU30863.1 AAA family ATPase [Alkanindiges illinoisensis]
MKECGTFSQNTSINNCYTVLYFLGESDGCEVYRIQNQALELKFLRLIKSELIDQIDLDRLQTDLNRISKFHHKNLVQCDPLQNFISQGVRYYYFLSDFISGETLSDLLIRRIRLNLYTTFDIILDVMMALKYLHDLPEQYIHGYVNPDNFYICYDDKKIKAYLFPIKISHYINGIKLSVQNKFDLSYMATDNLDGRKTVKGDIFSLMMVMYKCLTGVQAWIYDFDWQDSSVDFIKKQIEITRKVSAINHLSFYTTAVDEDFEKIVYKGLNQDYQNIVELSEALQHYAKDTFMIHRKSSNDAIEPVASIPKNTLVINKGLSAIAGMQVLKKQLQDDIISPLCEYSIYQHYRISPLNGILLYGAAGCGKTYIAQRIAEEINYHYIEVKPSDLASSYIHGTQEKIGRLFRQARENAPTLIFLDEVDAMLPKRDATNISHHYTAEVNEFLAQMTDCAEQNIFIIAATNRPEVIDNAILRTGRLDKLLYVPPPDFSTRQALLEMFLEGRPVDGFLDTYTLAFMTTGYVSSDLKFLVNEAAKLALKVQTVIRHEHFEEILKKYRPSISHEQITKYEKFRF